jgi:hypothetical protein
MKTMFKKALLTFGLCAGLCLTAMPAAAQFGVQVQIAPPPPEYIATTPPVYYEGRPAYWYNGYWHYRDQRGGWQYYREEPRFLSERRVREQPRYYYQARGGRWGHEEHRREGRHDERRR